MSATADSQLVFLLSPAHCGGRRAGLLLRDDADFPLAVRLRQSGDVTLGEAFAFMSGLYFRGKLAYARAFARSRGGDGVLVIAPGRGLVPSDAPLTRDDLAAMAGVDVSVDEVRYLDPLTRDARRLAKRLAAADRVVLLGSIASTKYLEPLERVLAPHLRFPSEFVGRGDMSRGGLMLRCVTAGHELTYVPIDGTPRHGPRPPKLAPLR